MRRLSRSSALRHLDRISVYVYVCHNFFIGSTIYPMFSLPVAFPVQPAAFVAVVVVFATLLCLVGEFVTRRVDKAVTWLLM